MNMNINMKKDTYISLRLIGTRFTCTKGIPYFTPNFQENMNINMNMNMNMNMKKDTYYKPTAYWNKIYVH